jgi:hypothetical protein
MNFKAQFTSIVLGLGIGVSAMLVLGSTLPEGHIGRYTATATGAQFLILDTCTGQAWLGDCHSTIQPVDQHFFDPKVPISE